MSTFRLRAKKISETYHMGIHISLGLIVALVAHKFMPDSSTQRLLIAGALGSVLPDLDHLLFILFYGRKTKYARDFKYTFLHEGFRSWWNFCKLNHKHNTQLISHNLLFMLLTVAISFWFLLERDSASMFVFMFAWFMHYTFDIFEDYLFFGKLNSNWSLKFRESYKFKRS